MLAIFWRSKFIRSLWNISIGCPSLRAVLVISNCTARLQSQACHAFRRTGPGAAVACASPWVTWQPWTQRQRPGTCTAMITITIIAATIAPSPTTTSIAHCLPLELPPVLVMSVQPCRDSYRACICQRRVSIREKVYKTVI
jgi:hypothetical protein